MMRRFCDAAVALDPAARNSPKAPASPYAIRRRCESLFRAADFKDVEMRAIDVPTGFRDFDDYWSPFLGGQAPAPGYDMSLSEDRPRRTPRAPARHAADRGRRSIRLIARAWAVRGAA